MGEWDDTVVVIENAIVEAKTRNAVLCTASMLNDLDDMERWIPFSQVDFSSEITVESKVGDTGLLIISNWIARKKGIV